MSFGNGLGILKDRVFRIGHLGDINDLTLLLAIAGVEMGLKLAGVPTDGGVDAAMAVLWRGKGTEGQGSRDPRVARPQPTNNVLPSRRCDGV